MRRIVPATRSRLRHLFSPCNPSYSLYSQKENSFHRYSFFVLTLLPQLVFNFRHQNILLNSFQRFLVSERSFQLNLGAYSKRLGFYYTAFSDKYYTSKRAMAIFAISLPVFYLLIRRKLPAVPATTLIIWWATPWFSCSFTTVITIIFGIIISPESIPRSQF